jgi:UDP:flavonoid glycosyltransferase YjiC (YdhE family)
MTAKRFLLVTWDGAGNLPPELALARELTSRGHKVDLSAQHGIRARAEAAGCKFIPLQSATQWDIAAKKQPEDELAHFIEHCWFSSAYADDIVSMAMAEPYDALLIDSNLILGLATALTLGIPTAALHHMQYGIMESGPLADFWDAQFVQSEDRFRNAGAGPFTRFTNLMEAADATIVFSYSGFDETAADVLHVGPLRSPGPVVPFSRRLPHLPMVLVGLSTSNQAQGPLLQRICNALGELEVEALVTTGPAIDPIHITHAGHGTVMAGITYGVPLLCVPMGRDQPMAAARVAELGLGTVLDQHAPVEAIKNHVELSLANQSVRLACTSFAKRLEMHPGADDAVQLLESLTRAG